MAEHYPNIVRQIDAAGHDIGYHSYYHRLPKNQTKIEFEKDLKKGLAILENITGKKVVYYRAPNFSLKNKWMLDSREYQMIYFHPNDFDINVPTPNELGFVRNKLNTIGTSSVLPKLEKLTNHFSFISISQALEQIKLEELERVGY